MTTNKEIKIGKTIGKKKQKRQQGKKMKEKQKLYKQNLLDIYDLKDVPLSHNPMNQTRE